MSCTWNSKKALTKVVMAKSNVLPGAGGKTSSRVSADFIGRPGCKGGLAVFASSLKIVFVRYVVFFRPFDHEFLHGLITIAIPSVLEVETEQRCFEPTKSSAAAYGLKQLAGNVRVSYRFYEALHVLILVEVKLVGSIDESAVLVFVDLL